MHAHESPGTFGRWFWNSHSSRRESAWRSSLIRDVTLHAAASAPSCRTEMVKAPRSGAGWSAGTVGSAIITAGSAAVTVDTTDLTAGTEGSAAVQPRSMRNVSQTERAETPSYANPSLDNMLSRELCRCPVKRRKVEARGILPGQEADHRIASVFVASEGSSLSSEMVP